MSKVSLWSTVASVCDQIVPDNLKSTASLITSWQAGASPLSTHASVAAAMAVYLITIFGGQAIMSNQKPMSLFTNFFPELERIGLHF